MKRGKQTILFSNTWAAAAAAGVVGAAALWTKMSPRTCVMLDACLPDKPGHSIILTQVFNLFLTINIIVIIFFLNMDIGMMVNKQTKNN